MTKQKNKRFLRFVAGAYFILTLVIFTVPVAAQDSWWNLWGLIQFTDSNGPNPGPTPTKDPTTDPDMPKGPRPTGPSGPVPEPVDCELFPELCTNPSVSPQP